MKRGQRRHGTSERDQQRLEALLGSHHALIRIVTSEEAYALDLLNTAALDLGVPPWVWSATRGLQGGVFQDKDAVPNTENAAAAMYHVAHRLAARGRVLLVTLDLAGHLHEPITLRALRDLVRHFCETDSRLVMLDHRDDIPDVIANEATRFELSLPDEQELERLIRNTLKRAHQRRPIEANVKRRELETIVRNLRGLSRSQAVQIVLDCIAEDRTFDASDINSVLAHKRQRLHRDGLLEFIETPVNLSSIGGLVHLKRWLRQRENALTDKAKRFGIDAPRGVLLLGVQGAGKSLSAKATAAAWKRPLLRLDPSVLYDRYLGESERRLRGALHQAEMMAPIILWIDEIEKGFASAASHSVDGGLSQRMFGTLLSWMQDHQEPVFLVATANNIDALPPELLRKGRFDEIFFVDLPTEEARRAILEIHLRKRGRDARHFDLASLAQCCEGYSGAEIEQAIISALHVAFEQECELATEHIVAALRASPPLSVTMAERIDALRVWARDRCVSAG